MYCQAQLKESTAVKLRQIVPGICAEDLVEIQKAPLRCFDPVQQQVIRLHVLFSCDC